ncbi:MAG: hypothetical protein ACYDE0_14640 [Acidiferrobacterales bacterium]
MNNSTRIVTLALAALLGSVSVSAVAESAFERNHPRRDQVNDRLATQNHRITQQVREGELNRQQARRLRRSDRRIRGAERRFARHHHGIISRSEQARLNRRENHLSRRIGQ